ncbi:hypothetical protein GJ496_005577 [Pomphorhynchus laevis]|nr:hypothetical protein GJ496_005577 [Pomphorhynchus laevis]
MNLHSNLATNLFKQSSVKALQQFNYFIVLDFEATCLKNEKICPQEIIEFPAIILSDKSFQPIAHFQSFVKPVFRPLLSDFCMELTGITQKQVNNAPIFPEVLRAFDKWINECIPNWNIEDNYIFVTCGNWDLGRILPENLILHNMQLPTYFKRWVNIKESFSDATNKYVSTLPAMLSYLHLPMHGRLHSGFDDCMNICRIVQQLGYRYHHMFKCANVVRQKENKPNSIH